MDNQVATSRPHSLSLENRKKIVMTGIESVESFNEKEIFLKLSDGVLSITGSNLNVEKLNVEDGNLTVLGEINGIKYSAKKASFIGKIFK